MVQTDPAARAAQRADQVVPALRRVLDPLRSAFGVFAGMVGVGTSIYCHPLAGLEVGTCNCGTTWTGPYWVRLVWIHCLSLTEHSE